MKSLFLGAFTAFVLPVIAMAEPAYYMFQLKLDDRDAYYTEYVPRVMPTLAAYNAKLLVAQSDPVAVEGEWTGNQTVIIEFESRKDAEDWYTSPEYADVRPYRMGAASVNNAVLFDAFVMPQ